MLAPSDLPATAARAQQALATKPQAIFKSLGIKFWSRTNGMAPTSEEIAMTERCIELDKLLSKVA
jgi:hypothetical protein